MTFYAVAFVAWACPGGWFSGLVPPPLRPVVCQAQPQVEVVSSLPLAEKRVRDVGPVSRLLRCAGLRCREVPVAWVTEPKFEEVGK